MILKLCAKCQSTVAYPAVYCDPCAKDHEAQIRQNKSRSDREYNARRDKKYNTFYHSREWLITREKRLQAAGYMCELCGKKIAADVHHTIPIGTPAGWAERLNFEELRAVCIDCHNQSHSRFGTKNERRGAPRKV